MAEFGKQAPPRKTLVDWKNKILTWIGRRVPIEWPATYPDLTPCVTIGYGQMRT